MSAKDALNRFYTREAKNLEREQAPRRRNEKPEFELTKKPCMRWFKDNGWSMTAIEAKAVYCFSSGRYLHGQADAGFADAAGCTPFGLGAFVEFKAPGQRSNLKMHQRDFLVEKIKRGAFAVCVDSVSCLESIWLKFQNALRISRHAGIDCLINHLPKERPQRPSPDESGLPF